MKQVVVVLSVRVTTINKYFDSSSDSKCLATVFQLHWLVFVPPAYGHTYLVVIRYLLHNYLLIVSTNN